MLKNGQKYFKNLAVFTPQDFSSMFGHFSTVMKYRVNEKTVSMLLKVLNE